MLKYSLMELKQRLKSGKVDSKIIKYIPPYFNLKKAFWDQWIYLNTTEYFDHNRLMELQFNSLKNLLTRSYKYSPYYRWLFKRISFNPYNIKTIEQLREIPILDKKIFQTI